MINIDTLLLQTTPPGSAPAPLAGAGAAEGDFDAVIALLMSQAQPIEAAAAPQPTLTEVAVLAEKVAALMQQAAQQVENAQTQPGLVGSLSATDVTAFVEMPPAVEGAAPQQPRATADIDATLTALLQDAPVTESQPLPKTGAKENSPSDISPEDMNALTAALNNIEPGAGGAKAVAAAALDAQDIKTLAATGKRVIDMLVAQGLDRGAAAQYIASLTAPAVSRPAGDSAAKTAPSTPIVTSLSAGQIESLQQLPPPPAATSRTPLNNTDAELPQADIEQPPAPQQQSAAPAKPATQSSMLALLAQMTPADAAESINLNPNSFAATAKNNALLQGESLSQTAGMTGTDQNSLNLLQQAAAPRGLPAQNVQMIALQMQRNQAAKVDTFTLRLDPANLGQMEVRMKFSRDGGMKAHLTVDRPETLSMLQKDSQQLERVLQQVGLDADEGSLSFDLRQHDDGAQDNKPTRTGIAAPYADDDGELMLQARIAAHEHYIGADGVNITV